ncbi:MAG: HTH domain-containing protein, partial [Lachnoclostridium sp.]|nr:HTH domain-containing protein [Lachnoclostridium sp.]
NKYKEHPWKNMSDMELLKSAGLYEKDRKTGKEGYNMACILLFGTKEAILSCVPGYKTDAIYRVDNMDRYDDRLIVASNLIESYDLLMEFIAKHTNDKFFLIDNVNMSVRSAIAREIVSNLLVHREFASAFPAKLIIEKNRIYTENWNRAQRVGKIEPQDFTPYPKNPILANFFVNIGYADSLGSGVRNLYKYTKIYSGGEPDLEEGDIFKLTVPIANLENIVTENNGLSKRQMNLLNIIRQNKSVTVDAIATELNVSKKTVSREIQEIKKTYFISYDKKQKQWVFK